MEVKCANCAHMMRLTNPDDGSMIGILIGAILGVGVMCLLQINKGE